MMINRLNRQVTLRDGRQLGFAEYGVLGGQPIFYFHGWPSSRLEAQGAHDLACELDATLIAVDRPGYGLSDFKPDRVIGDWPADVLELADHLKLERFAVLGMSGGGPYAAVAGAKLAARVSKVLLVCGVAPLAGTALTNGMALTNRCMLLLARLAPALARVLTERILERMRRQSAIIFPPQWADALPQCDQSSLASPILSKTLKESTQEAFRNGVRAAAYDASLYARPWGFRLQDIDVPVHLWHGELDRIVPPAMGRYYAKLIPNCRSTFYADEGHFSLPLNRFREIAETALG